jgi:DNA processing protein
MTTPAFDRLRREVASVTADGTDPDRLGRVLAWVVRPRCSPDALRRRCRDRTDALPDGPPSAQVAAVAGPPSPTTGEAALAIVSAWRARGVSVALIGDPSYPEALAQGWPHADAPTILAWRGAAPLAAPAVALVGARRSSGYGTGVAAWLAESAGLAGIRVVSGGAVGIDAAAHRAAAPTSGGTTVVLGCGHAVGYPRPHAAPGALFDQILDQGGTLVGELLPHEPPRAGAVRARNRIVAGLSDVVVVVEGGERSGGLLTADAAADRGRTVMAVPGDIRAPGSAAPHRLLADGAVPCTSPTDLLEAVRGQPGPAPDAGRPADGVARRSPSVLPEPLRAELERAWPRPVRVDRLAGSSGLAPAVVLAAVTRARGAGEVAESTDGVRLRRSP